MDNHALRILVVEDEPRWSGIIVDTLLEHLAADIPGAAPTLFVDGDAEFQKQFDLHVDREYQAVRQPHLATLLAVSSQKRAEDLISALPSLHMVTMDMELHGTSPKTGEKEGMLLLEKVTQSHPDAVSVVVSGRAGELDVARQSMAHYGAVDAILKGDELKEIEHSLRATLLLAEAVRLKHRDLEAARRHAERAAHLVDTMSKDTRANFKRRFDDFLRELETLSHASEIDEVSGLLNAAVITRYAAQLLHASSETGLNWAVGILVVDGLKEFEEAEGVFHRIEVVRAISLKMKEVQALGGSPNVHLGYLGEGKFVITAFDPEPVQMIYDHIAAWFQKDHRMFYSQTQGNPTHLLSLRFFLKKNTQVITAIDDLLSLTNAPERTPGTPTSW